MVSLCERNLKTPEEYLGEIRKASVRCTCLLLEDCETTVGVPPVALEAYARLFEKFPGEVIGFVGADPWKGVATLKKIERAVKEFGFRGLMISPFTHKLRTDDRRFSPIYAKCNELAGLDSYLPPLLSQGGTAPAKGHREVAIS